MERGRPRKRSDGASVGTPLGRSTSKRSKSADRRAFETLPQGWKPAEALLTLEQSEAAYIQKQALGQALRFEVLKREDVEALSKVSCTASILTGVHHLTLSRNFVILTNAPSTSDERTIRSVLAAGISTPAFASTSGHPEWPSSVTSPC